MKKQLHDYSDEQVLRVYKIILDCYRSQSEESKDMRNFTERSLAQVHIELEKRGLKKDQTDNTNPDCFAGY